MRPDRTKYRLIITRQGASEILLSTQFSALSLPRVDVVAGGRFAEQLVAQTEQNYKLETYCLSINVCPSSPEDPSSGRYAVMEAFGQDDRVPPAALWISSAIAVSDGILFPEERAAIRVSLKNLCRNAVEPAKAPFARPGWIEELFRWVENQINPLGLRLSGGFRQPNASPTFSLIRLETTGAAVWFKAAGEPNRQELPISIALDRLFPNCVPRILAVHPSWNGWLSEEVQGSTLDDPSNARAWTRAAKALADIQIASVPRTDELLESGCKDLRLDHLARQIDPFLTRMSELMALQAEEPPLILTDSDMGVLGDRLKAALDELEQCQLPCTLAHRDLNPRNILVSGSRCCFIDCAEGCVTHPFFSFEYLREHSSRRPSQNPVAAEQLIAAYLGPWRSFISPETLAQALAVSPVLAVFAYAVAGKKWSSPQTLQNTALAGYFRSLTRRAYREAAKIAARGDPCIA